MKARLVIDDISQEPHIFVFQGVEYDLQMTFATKAKLHKIGEMDADLNEFAYICTALKIMMNECIKREKRGQEEITLDDLMQNIPATEKVLSELSDFLNAINGKEPEDEADKELDALIDAEVPDDPQKN